MKYDAKSKIVLAAAEDHNNHCALCASSRVSAIGIGEAGCKIGQHLWRQAMEEFVRLHPQYKQSLKELLDVRRSKS